MKIHSKSLSKIPALKLFFFLFLFVTHFLLLTSGYANVLDDMIRKQMEEMGEEYIPDTRSGSPVNPQASAPPSGRRQMTDDDWQRMREQMQGPETQNITPEEWDRLNKEYDQKQRAARTDAERTRVREEFKQKMKQNLAGNTTPRRSSTPTAEELNELMAKLLDPNISELNKKRIAGVIFYHSDVYRNGVTMGTIKPESPGAKEFLEKYKPELTQDAMSRMDRIYRNKYGEPLKETVIPFSTKNIYSDDDLVTGSGETGRRMEEVFNEALNEVVLERVKRPMAALDRQRIDVNGLAWNMTEEAAYRDFYHPEKYINPQSGYANQAKLIEAAEQGKIAAYTFQDGRMVKLGIRETVEAIKRLAVDKPLDIPGIDPKLGSGSMSDFLRMAEFHKIRPSGKVTVEEIQHFIRNQKYSERVVGDYDKIFQADAELSREYAEFIEMSNKIRNAMTVSQIAEIFENHGVKIFTNSGSIDFDKLTVAMLKHQERQLAEVLPKMIGEVTKTEAYKIIEWLRTAGPANRLLIRKQLALRYAPMNDEAINKILQALDNMVLSDADKNFIRTVIKNDSRQVRDYAELINMSPAEMVSYLKLEGDNRGLVAIISKSAKVTPLTGAFAKRQGGSAFQEFLESKTAKALNLDTMLGAEASGGAKFMQWSLLLVAAGQAYSSASNNTEGLKAVGMAMFQMIPFVSSALNFSEDEYRESFKALAMDIYPPMALAQLGFTFLHYVAAREISGFTEEVWDRLAKQALADFNDSDFEKSSLGYYRLKNRQGYMNFLEEVDAGFGKTFKLSAMAAPEVDSLMSRNKDVQNNEAALYTILWFEGIKVVVPDVYTPQQAVTNWAMKEFGNNVNHWLTSFGVEKLKAKVYEEGLLQKGEASNVERVASKIILDNLRIRAEMYTKVLHNFVDRIEKLYNEEKGEKFKDSCDSSGIYEGVMTRFRGRNTDICDPQIIINETIERLKQEFENAPPKIKDSPWGMEKLQAEYDRWIKYLKDYKSGHMGELELRRQMQSVVDDFREFISKLVIAVDLFQEMRDLELTAHVFGGQKSMAESEMVLLGDVMRVGISARVSPNRKGLKWNVYYYAYNFENHSWSLLGSVNIKPQKFNPGNDGLWVIENPEKQTFYQLTKEQAQESFPVMRYYRILPVLAFGDWANDPISSVGVNALRNPIDYPELFEKDKAAFAAEAAEFGIVRASVFVAYPQWIYRGDYPQVKIALRIPEYAREENHEASIEISSYTEGAPLPAIDPKRYDPVSTDIGDPPQNPSVFSLTFPADTKDGTYEVKVSARIRSLDEKSQALPQTFLVNYVDQDNPEGSPMLPEAGSQLSELLTKIQRIEGQSQSIGSEISSIEKAFNEDLKGITQELEKASKEMVTLAKDLSSLESLANKMDARNMEASKASDDAYNAGQKCASARGEIENHAAQCCQLAQSIKGTDNVQQLNQFIEQLRGEDATTHEQSGVFRQELNNARMSSRQAESILKEINSLKANREEAKTKVSEKENAVSGLQARLSELESHLTLLQGKIPQLQGIISEAAGIIGEVQAINQNQLTKDDKKAVKEIQAAFARISRMGTQYDKVYERNKDKLNTPKDKLKNLENSITEAKGRVSTLLSLQINDEAIGKIQKFLEEARASYDAAQLFDDPVRTAVRNSELCAKEAEKFFTQKTSPDAQVAQWDCSMYPGTLAKWDTAKKTPYCECAPGNLWDDQKYKCVAEEEYYMARVNCSMYQNSHPEWDARNRKALCYCDNGYEWNNARSACRVASHIQVSQANCSAYPGTSAVWDNAREAVQCYCAQGYYWDQGQNRCVQTYQPPQQPGGGQDLGQVLGGLIDIYNRGTGGGSGGADTSAGGTGGSNPWSGSQQQQQTDPCESNFYFYGYTMVCGCSGYTFNTQQNKCIPGGGESTGGTTTQGSGQNTQSGLSDVTVNRSPTQITVWDHGTEDYDTVNIYLNNQLVQGGLVLRNARQSLTLYLNPGNNILTVEAVNEGDPEINKRMNLPRGNAAAIEISGVTSGRQSQQWTLYTGQTGTLQIYYQP